MVWFVLALVSCAFNVAVIEIVRRCRLNPYEALLYRCLIGIFLLLPFFTLFAYPTDPRFYLFMILMSGIYAWGNIAMGNLAAQRNGRIAVLYQPLMIFLTFIMWTALHPDELDMLLQGSQTLLITGLCFGVLVFSLACIRRNDYAWKSVMAAVPIAVLYALLTVGQAWFLNAPDAQTDISQGGQMGRILSILFFGNMGMVIALPFFARYRVQTPELDLARHAAFPIVTMTILAVLGVLSWGAMLYALQIADNPAYPVAIKALMPVMFQVYYWIRGWKDHASPVAGMGLALSALMLGFIHP